MNYLDMFHGIGGFALGAWMAGMKFENHYCSDIERYCIDLYKLRFPESIQLGDITKINYEDLPNGEWIITGGFPCQPHSVAGERKASEDERDLWGECVRAIRLLRPTYAIFENVRGLFSSESGTFFDRVLRDLAKLRYDAEWGIISAQQMGAPHKRERVWIIAFPHGHSQSNVPINVKEEQEFASNPERIRLQGCREKRNMSGSLGLCHRERKDKIQRLSFVENTRRKYGEAWGEVATRLQGQFEEWNPCGEFERSSQTRNGVKAATGITGVDDGVSHRVERLKGCGNAIVPQIAKLLFEKIKIRG